MENNFQKMNTWQTVYEQLQEIQDKIADKKTCFKHWMAETRFYKTFFEMKYRCSHKSKWMNHKHYFDKWIVVERENFQSFMNDMYKSYLELSEKIWEENVSIERIDNNNNYCKENCKRIHIKEQSKNKSNNVYYSHNWITDTLAWWSRRLNIQRPTLRRRIIAWRSIERTLTTMI